MEDDFDENVNEVVPTKKRKNEEREFLDWIDGQVFVHKDLDVFSTVDDMRGVEAIKGIDKVLN